MVVFWCNPQWDLKHMVAGGKIGLSTEFHFFRQFEMCFSCMLQISRELGVKDRDDSLKSCCIYFFRILSSKLLKISWPFGTFTEKIEEKCKNNTFFKQQVLSVPQKFLHFSRGRAQVPSKLVACKKCLSRPG